MPQYDVFAAKPRMMDYVTYLTAESAEDAIEQAITHHTQHDLEVGSD